MSIKANNDRVSEQKERYLSVLTEIEEYLPYAKPGYKERFVFFKPYYLHYVNKGEFEKAHDVWCWLEGRPDWYILKCDKVKPRLTDREIEEMRWRV